jgi:hypothetical protein
MITERSRSDAVLAVALGGGFLLDVGVRRAEPVCSGRSVRPDRLPSDRQARSVRAEGPGRDPDRPRRTHGSSFAAVTSSIPGIR